MKLLVVFSLSVAAAFAAVSGVEELKTLLGSAKAAGETDNKIASRVSQFRLGERLGDATLAAIRANGIGPRTSAMLDLLADESEFEPASSVFGSAPLSPLEADALLAKMSKFAVNYIHNLPDFICTRVNRRYDTRAMQLVENRSLVGELHLLDTIASEVSFDHGKESHAAQTVNGEAHERPVPGLTTWGEFGGILGTLLASGAGPQMAWSRWEWINGIRAAVFHYSVDAGHSQYSVSWSSYSHTKQTYAAFSGELSIDPVSGGILRVTRRALPPRQAPMKFIDTVVKYQSVPIGGSLYLCPVKSVTRSLWKAGVDGFVYSLNEATFGAYHKFAGESMLVASDAPPEPEPEARAPLSLAALSTAPVSTRSELKPLPATSQGNPDTQAPPLPAQGVTLRTTTRLVDAAAIVIDRHGNPVLDLQKEDFQVFDNGKPQNIRVFSTPTAGAPAPVELPPAASQPASLPRVFSNRVKDGSRANAPTIILIDEGAGTREERFFVRDRVLRFLRQASGGDPIGLYRPMNGGVGIVREFTLNSTDLITSLEEWNDGMVPLQSLVSVSRDLDKDAPSLAQHCPSSDALAAITASANHLAAIAARKTLIWVSAGQPKVEETLHGKPLPQNCIREEKEALQALNNANVALYAIDSRGLQTAQPDATIGAKELGCYKGCDSGADVNRTLDTMTQRAFRFIERDPQVLVDLSERAGGRAFLDNDTLGALRASVSESHTAYALGFYPESLRSDGSDHQIEVKVPGRPDLTVRYRRGYVDKLSDPKEQIRAALWSPLDATAIPLRVEQGGDPSELRIVIGVQALDLQQNAGRWQGKLHVILAQKDERGQQYDYRDDTLKLDLKSDTYESMLKVGLTYREVLKPNPKANSLRLVVCDEAGNLGSVTIPLGGAESPFSRR